MTELELQIGFGPSESDLLVATWDSPDWFLDQWIELADFESSPEGMARRAHAWMTEQLARPIERLTWRTWRRNSISLWRFSDSGQPFWWDHLSARSRFDRGLAPDSVDQLR
jgi:hypothetical protein